MSTHLNLKGQRFGKLVVVSELVVVSQDSNRVRKRVYWNCKCDCGEETVTSVYFLKESGAKSCSSCRNITHGNAKNKNKSAEYTAWNNMLNGHKEGSKRSHIVKKEKEVCERWRESFENFFADMGTRPIIADEILLINNDGIYELSNCRWGTRTEMIRKRGVSVTNKTGTKGVWKKPNGKYQVAIHVKSKKTYIGTFDTLTEAVYAREKAEEYYWATTLL